MPYSLDMAPQRWRRLSDEQRYPSQMHPQQRQQQQQAERRTWSLGSSTLSSSTSSFESATSSLDLVEYAVTESTQEPVPAASTFVLHTPSPAPKVRHDVSAALDPSGWFSVASSTPSPPAMVLEPMVQSDEEPFVGLPASTSAPDTGELFPAAPSPTPSSSRSQAVAISPTPSVELPTTGALVADEALPYVPAPTDAWMDDEFYRNLFSSLGFEMEVGIGVDGFGGADSAGQAGVSGGGGTMGGGLTLRMDELQRMEAL